MSGYAEETVGRTEPLPKEVHFIHKPFSSEQLVAVVRRALAAASARG
jgi:FixJ family two-component response regulator